MGLVRSRPAPEGSGRVRRAAQSVGSLREKRGRRRLYLRLLALAGVCMLGYLCVTFGQVWWMSRRDGAREADAAVVLGAAQYDGRPSRRLIHHTCPKVTHR